jgi:trigger factor
MLNVQTEHLENHTARITVDVDAEQINQAMRQAARQIAKKARIPGFRPGKAPFNVIVTMFGYEYVLGEALDKIGNDIYRGALEASGVEPYAPGSLENMDVPPGWGIRCVSVTWA